MLTYVLCSVTGRIFSSILCAHCCGYNILRVQMENLYEIWGNQCHSYRHMKTISSELWRLGLFWPQIWAIPTTWYGNEMSFSKIQRWFQQRCSFFKTLMAYVSFKDQIMVIISLACSNLASDNHNFNLLKEIALVVAITPRVLQALMPNSFPILFTDSINQDQISVICLCFWQWLAQRARWTTILRASSYK